MFFDARVLFVAKDSQYAHEYEDAFHLDAARGLAAVADGVSSAIFSRQWADILVRAAVENPPDLFDTDVFQQWLAAQRARWAEQIDVPGLPWNLKQKLRQVGGAFATLLWVELYPAEPNEEGTPQFRFRGFALGDSCLFHVRGGQVLRAFPLEKAADFELDPLSICSADLNCDNLLEFRMLDDDCLAGDLLVLCTDAVAKWAMTLLEEGQTPDWEAYCELPEEAWQAEIEELRRTQAMRRDDTTLVLLRIGAQPAAAEPDGDTVLAMSEPAEVASNADEILEDVELEATADLAAEPVDEPDTHVEPLPVDAEVTEPLMDHPGPLETEVKQEEIPGCPSAGLG